MASNFLTQASGPHGAPEDGFFIGIFSAGRVTTKQLSAAGTWMQ
jgi:hypothetical protein